MTFTITIEMDREGQIRRRLVGLYAFLEQQRIGAKVDETFPRDQTGDNLRQLLVEQRLSARDGNHRGPAFIRGGERLLDADAFVENMTGVVDLAATGAGEVAAKQRLQHQHQWITSDPAQLLSEDIHPHANLLP